MPQQGGGEGDEAKQRRQEASLASIQAGGLPLDAARRLQDLADRQGTEREFFTSDLSVNELVLTHECGFEPLGQVMGCCIYHVGWQYMPSSYSNWGSSQELTTLTQAYYEARHLAMKRLRDEARLLRADGVVGVRMERNEYDWGPGLIEFRAIGTAVRATNAPPAQAEPFLSSLSGQEHWSLRQAGLKPVGFVLGNCTYYQVASWQTRNATQGGFFGGGWYNQELTDFTQAVYIAREYAMQRMDAEARALQAAGVVGVWCEPELEEREVSTGNDSHRTDLVIHFTALGTAVVHESDPVRMPDIPLFIPLNDKKP